MRDGIRETNQDLLHRTRSLRTRLLARNEQLPEELVPCFGYACDELEDIERAVEENLAFVVYGETIEQELLSSTHAVTRKFRAFNRLAAHLFRAVSDDRLCLKFIRWVHAQHKETNGVPFAFSNDEFSMLPSAPPIYFVPIAAQYGLLYLPLLLHEFGHLLYILHRPEMEQLINELQIQIKRLLEPAMDSDDFFASREERQRSVIAERWFEWTQEFFCDAVGLQMAGPAYLNAVSRFTKWLGRDEFSLSERELQTSNHPVTLLRIRLLCERAVSMGFDEIGRSVLDDWEQTASALGVTEEHFGFFEPSFGQLLSKTVDDMLAEAAPPRCLKGTRKAGEPWTAPDELLNDAWTMFLTKPGGYDAWEREQIGEFARRF